MTIRGRSPRARSHAAEGEVVPGQAIAEDGARYLQAINFKDQARRMPAMAAE